MLWPDILRGFADRLEADPMNTEMIIDTYNLVRDGKKMTEQIEIRLNLPLDND